MKQHIDTLQGTGMVTSHSGEVKTVIYKLDVYQEVINCGHLGNTSATGLSGLNECRLVVDPVCFFNDNDLLLTMQDGRTLKFLFTNMKGTIRVLSWIGS